MKFSILAAAVLLTGSHSFASAQGTSGPASGGDALARQCWDTATKQLRQRTAADATSGRGGAPVKEPADTVPHESGSSEGMAGLTPGTKGSATARAAEEEAAPSGRPPGMPDC
jgi:hypothetical protein